MSKEINKGLTVFEAFSGYGSHKMTLQKYDVPHESVGISEIDKEAIIAYNAVHGGDNRELFIFPSKDIMLAELEAKNIGLNFKAGKCSLPRNIEKLKELYYADSNINNFGDISLIDPEQIPSHDLFTYSFPCQDISMAGLQRGLKWKCVVCGELYDPSMRKADGCPKCGELEADKTRSSLLWECKKIIELKRPKYLMMENVKNLVGKKHKADFDRWLKILEDLGYNNYWKVINAKNCGVPQNRERVFCVSILKSVDDRSFKFLDDFDNGIRLKDVLEDDVDEKYYLSDEKCESLIKALFDNGYTDYQKAYTTDGNAYCIDASYAKGTSPGDVGKSRRTHIVEPNSLNMVGMLDIKGNESIRRVYEPKGLSPALTTMQGGNRQPKIVEACAIRGRNPINPKSRKSGLETVQMLEVSENPDINNCLTTVQKDTMLLEKPLFRIRKLTPTECFRLMGVKDQDIDKIKSTGISNSQMYKLAGNSIVTNAMGFLKNLPH